MFHLPLCPRLHEELLDSIKDLENLARNVLAELDSHFQTNFLELNPSAATLHSYLLPYVELGSMEGYK